MRGPSVLSPGDHPKLEIFQVFEGFHDNRASRAAIHGWEDPQQGAIARIGLVSGTEWPGRPSPRAQARVVVRNCGFANGQGEGGG